MRKLEIFVLLLSLLACDTPIITGPSDPPPPPPITDPPPRVDELFDWNSYRGYSAFGLLAHNDETILATIRYAKALGWNGPRICAELENWEDDYYYPRVPRRTNRLNEVLDLLAREPGVQVLLVGNCTLKGPATYEAQAEWNRTVANIAAQYKNIAYEVVNEYENCASEWGPYCPGEREIERYIMEARAEGIQWVGADMGLSPGGARTSPLWALGATFVSWHPARTHHDLPWDPPDSLLAKVARLNRGTVYLTETVAFDDSSEQCDDPLRTCNLERVQNVISTCFSVAGCNAVYHSLAGLRGEGYTWFPIIR